MNRMSWSSKVGEHTASQRTRRFCVAIVLEGVHTYPPTNEFENFRIAESDTEK